MSLSTWARRYVGLPRSDIGTMLVGGRSLMAFGIAATVLVRRRHEGRQ